MKRCDAKNSAPKFRSATAKFLGATPFLAFRLFFVALRILGVAPTEGEKGVALIAGEKTPIISPLWSLQAPESQEFYNCLRQGYGVAPKIWSFCTFEFTVHSALFLAVCKQRREQEEEILRSEKMEKQKRKFCQNNNKANWFK